MHLSSLPKQRLAKRRSDVLSTTAHRDEGRFSLEVVVAKLFLRLVVSFACIALTTSAVEAHPHLKSADPATDSTVATSPAAIRLTFSMPIIAKFSRIRLSDSAGKEIQLAEGTIDPKDSKQVVVAVPAQLAPGVYSVEWRIVGVDTHWKTGSYKFQIKE